MWPARALERANGPDRHEALTSMTAEEIMILNNERNTEGSILRCQHE